MFFYHKVQSTKCLSGENDFVGHLTNIEFTKTSVSIQIATGKYFLVEKPKSQGEGELISDAIALQGKKVHVCYSTSQGGHEMITKIERGRLNKVIIHLNKSN